MKIEVKNLLNQPEGSVENCPIELAEIPLDESMAKVTGEALLTNLGDFILAQITGKAQIIQPCSRCLTEVALTIPLKFSREFKTIRHPGLVQDRIYDSGVAPETPQNDDDEEVYPIKDGKIDLAPPLTEEIIANLPIKPLCSDACKGLCQKCGANLNDNPCKCDKVKDEISNKIKF